MKRDVKKSPWLRGLHEPHLRLRRCERRGEGRVFAACHAREGPAVQRAGPCGRSQKPLKALCNAFHIFNSMSKESKRLFEDLFKRV